MTTKSKSKKMSLAEHLGRSAIKSRHADDIRRRHPDWTWGSVEIAARRLAGLPPIGCDR